MAKDGLEQFTKDYFNLSIDKKSADVNAGSIDNKKFVNSIYCFIYWHCLFLYVEIVIVTSKI